MLRAANYPLGYVRLEVFFTARLTLPDHDPILVADFSNVSKFQKRILHSDVNGPVDERMLDYAIAKGTGKCTGNHCRDINADHRSL